MEAAALIRAIPVPAVLISRDERVLSVNQGAEALFGPGLEGRHYITVLRQPPVLDCIETALKTGQPEEGRLPSRDAAGDKTYRIGANPVAGSGEILLTLEDISHVEEAGQMRRDFVANVSHELRTPLTALSGFIETLQGSARDDPAAQARFLGIMAKEAGRMSRLIQDLLSLSRVESEERVRPTGRADLSALVNGAAATLATLAADNHVALTVTGTERPAEVTGDSDQLAQVITNLLENAIKYGGGAVEVSVSRQDHDPALRGPAQRIEVRDNGPGIDPLHLARLTERFYRVDSHRSREIGGTGLGLAIVKHIVNRHRGRLRISSENGQGSSFVVVLPAT